MNMESERLRLTQAQAIEYMQRPIQANKMVTVYQEPDRPRPMKQDHFITCALIPSDQVEEALSRSEWVLQLDGGMPAAESYGTGSIKYLRFGNDAGIEPLVTRRYFYGIREGYVEISEEFRHFHNLDYDASSGKLIKVDENGEEHTVAVVHREPNRVEIRLKEIRQFLAVKEMHLAIQFDYREFSQMSLEELGLVQETIRVNENTYWWKLDYANREFSFHDFGSYSILHGLWLIDPLPKSQSGFPGFADEPERKYTDFIIGMDEIGNELEYTCNPSALSNMFGANPGAPNYLTKVDFRKGVLDKYFQQHSKYEVSESYLRCAHLWGIPIDNYNDDKVSVWLGDLGEKLNYEEQLYWRSYNFVSETGVSETFFSQQILANPTESERPEHILLHRYDELAEACEDHLGWSLLLPLEAGDQYHLQNIRVPAANEQRDFDELVQGLAKILIDSLNEKQLETLFPSEQYPELKGSIVRLEAALENSAATDFAQHTRFLRNLQNLRSSGSAHRKGSKYMKVIGQFDVDSKDLRLVFDGILQEAVASLDYLIKWVTSRPELETA